MKKEIITKFKGTINEVEIDKEYLFNSLEYIMEQIEEKFGSNCNQELTRIMYIALKDTYLTDSYTLEEIENEFEKCIKNALKVTSIKLSLYGEDYNFSYINSKIKNISYFRVLEEANDDQRKQLEEILKDFEPEFADAIIGKIGLVDQDSFNERYKEVTEEAEGTSYSVLYDEDMASLAAYFEDAKQIFEEYGTELLMSPSGAGLWVKII